jgi:hypothetical protein
MPWTYCVSTNFDNAVAARQEPVSFVDATPQRVQKAEEHTEKPQTFAEKTTHKTLASALLQRLNISID